MDRTKPSELRGGAEAIFEVPPVSDAKAAEEQEVKERHWCSSSSTSSIGRNSDLSSDGENGEENEVQSSYKGPLNMMDSLEEVLPMRRGISSFYNGKSKSFTSLADASSTCSIKDIAKQENAYTKRRRNRLAINHLLDKNRGNGKRPITSSRSSLALAVAMSSSESIASTSDDSSSQSPLRLPPLHPRSRGSSWRSYSVADFQQCRNDVNSN